MTVVRPLFSRFGIAIRQHWAPVLALLLLNASLTHCGDDDDSGASGSGASSGAAGSSGSGGSAGGQACTDCTPTGSGSYVLANGDSGVLWTATVMDKILREATPPELTDTTIHLYAAKNEFEPFQIAVNPKSDGNVSLTMTDFSGPGTIDRIELRRVEYVHITNPSDSSAIPSSYIPDPLEPASFGSQQAVVAGQNQPFWITIYVPENAPAGDYTSTLTVSLAGQNIDVPVELHVYDFALPKKIGFDGNWNSSFQSLGGSESLDKVREIKTFFFEHRLVPSGVAWPAGLNYNGGIEYDCASGTFIETNNAYDFSQLGPEYIDGKNWNGTGFPSFEIMQFVDNSTPRPSEFCGVSRGDSHYGTDAYNQEWSKLLAAIDKYLVDHHWEDKGYYYVQNEPQGPDDYDVAAFLANLSKTAAPHLRIAVSEEPKAEIVENQNANGHSFDMWWADLSEFDPAYAETRQAAGDDIWWYFLYGDLPPHFNPITIDHPGIESRIPFWGAWKYRVKGFAYYSVTGWGDNAYEQPQVQGTNQNGDGFLLYPPKDGKIVTSIRWELLREGEEDFEYFLLASGGTIPQTPSDGAQVDTTVLSAVSSTTSFTQDSSAFQNLRNQLGLKLEGAVNGWPVLDSKPPGAHEKKAYYINFQDPAGEPSANPLTVDGHEWTKIGWEGYDVKKGYGWSGPNIGDAGIMLYAYVDEGPNELQKSIIYDDYGRTDTFNWDIENGSYKITVSIGWAGRTYSKQRIVVEGQVLFDNAETTPDAPYLVQSITVDVTDGNVTLEAGQTDEYTMLNWLSIEPQ